MLLKRYVPCYLGSPLACLRTAIFLPIIQRSRKAI
jgi:hypothetical protein